MIADCTAIILAGGESKRMGRDKAALPFNGETLLQSVIASVQPLFAQTLVSVREKRADVALPQICDTQSDGGPLVGLISALEEIKTPWAFVVACDMPFVAPALIAHLASLRENHQAVVPQVNGHAQPLAAFYARSALPFLQSSLASGNKSLIGALKTLDVRYVEAEELVQSDPQLRSFFDLDTPQDVVIAEGMK
ncbi:MAG: molybdopterin-guanine dinucleotide biosynthesis protein [Gallionellaceae bacterium]|nr:MAG: molybdopterin-guanine dinucleotide biosynthesis protein [Gallionellaceae bacterium]